MTKKRGKREREREKIDPQNKEKRPLIEEFGSVCCTTEKYGALLLDQTITFYSEKKKRKEKKIKERRK